jgi:cysteine desulfurase
MNVAPRWNTNTPLIVGLAEALRFAYEELEARTALPQTTRSAYWWGIGDDPNAALKWSRRQRLPAHASFVFENIHSGTLVSLLDEKDIAASAASACKTVNPEPSSVRLALGYDRETAACSLRLTVGIQTKPQDIDYTVKTLVATIKTLIRKPEGQAVVA